METLKSYTDFEQSKKLVEILPVESADMIFQLGEDKYADSIKVPLTKKHWEKMMPAINPCWSLAALLNAIPQEIFCGDYVINITKGRINKWVLTYDHCVNRNHSNYGLSSCADTLVDACVEMIVKLHKQNLL